MMHLAPGVGNLASRIDRRRHGACELECQSNARASKMPLLVPQGQRAHGEAQEYACATIWDGGAKPLRL